MESENSERRPERRREDRYPMEAQAIIRRIDAEILPAIAADISSAGMLLHVEQPSLFRVGEEVEVEVALPDGTGKPFSRWGVGRIVRIDGCRFGIELHAGEF